MWNVEMACTCLVYQDVFFGCLFIFFCVAFVLLQAKIVLVYTTEYMHNSALMQPLMMYVCVTCICIHMIGGLCRFVHYAHVRCACAVVEKSTQMFYSSKSNNSAM